MKKISLLVQELEYELLQGSLEGEISELVYDTRKVCKDAMFVCIVGTAFDSHEKAAEVAAAGAVEVAVVCEMELQVVKYWTPPRPRPVDKTYGQWRWQAHRDPVNPPQQDAFQPTHSFAFRPRKRCPSRHSVR